MWLITVYADMLMDIKTDNAMSISPLTTFSKIDFFPTPGLLPCLAVPWAFRALLCRKKSQLSWFRRPLFFCFGGGEDGAENKLLKGYCPVSSLSVLHTPSSATLLAGWGMGWKGAQQDNRGLGGGGSSDRSISFSINQETAGSFWARLQEATQSPRV